MYKIASELTDLFPTAVKKDWGKYDMSEGHYFPITFTFENNSRVKNKDHRVFLDGIYKFEKTKGIEK